MRYIPGLMVMMMLLLAGCDDRPIERYRAPKQARPTLMAAPVTQAPAEEPPLSWTLPPGWRAAEAVTAPRVAAFTCDEGPVEVSVTVFPGDVGGVLANVNRWRQQAQLAPVESLEEQELKTYRVDGREVYHVELPGLAAVGIADGPRTWFVKMTGQPPAVAEQAEAFALFVRSLQWPASAAAEGPQVPGMAEGEAAAPQGAGL